MAAGAAWRLHTEETHETVHEDVAHHGVERVRGHRARRQQISRPRLVHTLRKQSSGGVESITTGTGGEHQVQYLKEMMAVRWEKQKSSKASQSQTRKKQNLGKSWFFTGSDRGHRQGPRPNSKEAARRAASIRTKRASCRCPVSALAPPKEIRRDSVFSSEIPSCA